MGTRLLSQLQAPRISIASFVVLAALFLPGAGGAATITVTTTDDEVNVDSDCSLREAIEAAASDAVVDACDPGSGADVIVLPAATYSLASVGTTLSLSGEVTLDGADATTTIIEAANAPATASFGVLRVEAGANATIRGVTIRNGVAGNNGSYCGGGGIFNAGTLTVLDAVITENRTSLISANESGGGGGICSSGQITLIRCTISDNRTGNALWSGGGGGVTIKSSGALVAHHVTVSGNLTGSGSYPGDGGGLYLTGPSTILDSSIVDNHTAGTNASSSGYAGGVYNAATATIERTLIANNSTGDVGGTGWYSGLGGGMYNIGALTMRSCTFSGNHTGNATGGSGYGGDGGGLVHQNDALLVLHNCTITSNWTGSGPGGGGVGGGIYSSGPEPGDPYDAEIMSTIISGNSVGPAGGGPDCGGIVLSAGYNLVNNTLGCTIESQAASDVTGEDPFLGPLDDYGGPTLTHSLTATSPVFDTIPAGVNGCGGVVATDQRGTRRPLNDGCEMGAFEVGTAPLFRDGLESGETGFWSASVDGGSA